MTDRLILAVARLLHAKKTGDAFLRERINYMYITPSVWFSKKLRREMGRLGLMNVRDCGYPNSSPGQFQHRLCICAKPAQAAVVPRTA